ncbi:MAG TPA: hypothetical protein VNR64_15335 [Vicinamibacterales bacterium]|nr:hypothetical protein [Vicinamibacterales bacterium]
MIGNHWGILINAPSIAATGNIISSNTVHANGRAGIAILGANRGNTVRDNDASGNGLLNLPPSLRFDLFEAVIGGNLWQNNQGTTNFVSAVSSTAAAGIAGEGMRAGGCIPGGQ